MSERDKVSPKRCEVVLADIQHLLKNNGSGAVIELAQSCRNPNHRVTSSAVARRLRGCYLIEEWNERSGRMTVHPHIVAIIRAGVVVGQSGITVRPLQEVIAKIC